MRYVFSAIAFAYSLFLASTIEAQPGKNVVAFVDAGFWQAPNGATTVYIECWGAGAPSGGSPIGTMMQTWSGGGGGGAYAAITADVTPGKKYYACPAGNNSSASYIFDRTPDNTTIFEVSAASGKIGECIQDATNNFVSRFAAGGKGGQASDCVGKVKFSGGNGGRGLPSAGGGGGAGAWSSGPGGNGGDAIGTVAGIGGKGPSLGSKGHDSTQFFPIKPGDFPGGGSGGGINNASAGTKGKIQISW